MFPGISVAGAAQQHVGVNNAKSDHSTQFCFLAAAGVRVCGTLFQSGVSVFSGRASGLEHQEIEPTKHYCQVCSPRFKRANRCFIDAAYDESTLSKLVPLTADSVFETFKKEYSDFDFRRIAAGKRKIRSMNAVWNLIEITNPPQARLIGKHYHFRRNGKLWRISAMTDSGKEFFDKVLPIMEKSIATIAFGT